MRARQFRGRRPRPVLRTAERQYDGLRMTASVYEYRRAGDRRRPCRHRGGAGGGAAGRQDGAADHQSRHRRPDELQPGHRRRGQGADRPRDRRPGRRDGPGDRRHRHPVPHAQPPQGPGHARPAGPGRQEGLSARNQTPRRRAAEPDAAAGSRRGPAGRRRRRRRAARIVGVRVPRRRDLSRRRRRADDRHVPASADAHRRSQDCPAAAWAKGPRAGISGALARLGFELARFKTGTPPRLNGRTIDYVANRTAARRRRAAAVLVPHRARSTASRCPAGSPTPTPRSTS